MEPLSAISTILVVANLLAVADNFYRGVTYARRAIQDPKIDSFYVRLITEKARYAEWKRRMGIETTDDVETLISKLPEGAQRSLPLILAPMHKYIKVAEQLFVKYGIVPPDTADSHHSFRDKLRRIDLLVDGHRHLNDLLDTLKSCNDGLLTIAPPRPGYHVSVAGNDPTLVVHEAQYTERDSHWRSQPPQSASDPQLSLASSNRRAEIAAQSSSTSAIKTTAQESSKRVFHPLIELLHSTCLRVFRSMAMQYSDLKGTFQGVGDRLEI